MKKIKNRLKTDKIFRTKVITYITMVYNFVWSVFKIAIGILRMSWVYVMSGTYNIFIGSTKNIFLQNHGKESRKDKKIDKEKKSLIMGILVLISGLAFAIYMGSLLFFHTENTFTLIWAIFIAACSFVELGIAIFNLVKVRKNNDILLSSLRCANLVSALFAIVITQVALLSTSSTVAYAHIFNAITGIAAGLCAIAIGIALIVRASKLMNKSSNAPHTLNQ